MPSYEVVEECYVPLAGGLRFKSPGQVVTLSEEEAKNLAGYVEAVSDSPVVRKPDTGIVVRKPDRRGVVRKPDTADAIQPAGGVIADVGEQKAGDE